MNEQGRLLVVDDEARQLEALCDVLRHEGHHVEGCTDPGEALGRLRTQRFDVLLSDLNMPGVDGISLARQATQADPDLVCVLMTGEGTVATAVEAMKAGALDYVLKPFRIAAMRPVLARAFQVRRLREDKRLLQEKVDRRSRQLEAANKELDAFAARIAHDLRGPVLGMLGFARVVHERSQAVLDPQLLGYLQRIVAAGERAERMIGDLLNFARLGDRPLERKPVALDAVVLNARRMLEPQSEGRVVEWTVAPLPTVSGDASLLEQVYVNLLSNALKYTRTRERARIEVGHRKEGDHHVLWVRDNGVGFDPEYADRLFSPFQRLHRQDQFEGNGIGLANVKRIVDRHGGSVSAQSQPDEATTLTFTLPAGPA